MTPPLISVLVAFYNDKNTLARCLNSITNQTYKNFEIVIVNDGSTDKEQNKNYKLLVKQIQRENKKNKSIKKILYYAYKKNLGIVEARRICVNLCSGKFCIFVDSDDFLQKDALENLYNVCANRVCVSDDCANLSCISDDCATESPDIVQGCAAVFSDSVNFTEKENFSESCKLQDKIQLAKKKAELVHIGALYNGQIVADFLCNHGHSNFMWAKLFKTSVVKSAFCNIPPVKASLAEDLLIYYFICKSAKCYVGISDVVYNYNVSTGMTSNVKITELARWEQICSVAFVFRILYSYMEQNELPEDEEAAIKKLCVLYLKNNLSQLKCSVDESLQEQAKTLLYAYWGKSFVLRVEKM